MTPCVFSSNHWRFGETCCLRLQDLCSTKRDLCWNLQKQKMEATGLFGTPVSLYQAIVLEVSEFSSAPLRQLQLSRKLSKVSSLRIRRRIWSDAIINPGARMKSPTRERERARTHAHTHTHTHIMTPDGGLWLLKINVSCKLNAIWSP
jgi:hypothetical protein